MFLLRKRILATPLVNFWILAISLDFVKLQNFVYKLDLKQKGKPDCLTKTTESSSEVAGVIQGPECKTLVGGDVTSKGSSSSFFSFFSLFQKV